MEFAGHVVEVVLDQRELYGVEVEVVLLGSRRRSDSPCMGFCAGSPGPPKAARVLMIGASMGTMNVDMRHGPTSRRYSLEQKEHAVRMVLALRQGPVRA